MKFLTAIFVVVAIFSLVLVTGGTATRATAESTQSARTTYQGKTIIWWANRAVRARKDVNALTIRVHMLKKDLHYNPSIEECIKLATIAYPKFTEKRAWQIIYHESWMKKDPAHAVNPTAVWDGEHASGLYQMLPSTFNSTPYGKAGMSIWSPCATSLAAGWMHETGRGREWAIGTGISGN